MTSVVSTGPPDRAVRDRWIIQYDAPAPVVPHPAPLVPARLARGTDNLPDAALATQRTAVARGWSVSVIYAHGTVMYADGDPGPLAESVSVRCWRFPGQRAVALWLKPEGRPWGADEGWLWTVGQLPHRVGVMAVKDALADKAPKEPKEPPVRASCDTCAALVLLRKDGSLRVHGPKDDRCGGRPLAAVKGEG